MERLAGRVILAWGWRRALLAFLAGAFAVLAQAPFDFFAVCFISFPVLVWLLDGAVQRRPASLFQRLMPFFGVGWWFGFGYFLAGLWWVGGALLVEAEDFAWALPFTVVGLPLLMAFFTGAAAVIARPFWSNGLGRLFGLAFGFGIAEWLRSFLLSGFPWNPVGLAAMPVPLAMQSAHLVGVLGMNALAVFVFSVPALLSDRRGLRTGLTLALLMVAAHLGYGAWRLHQPDEPGKTLSVRIVQPNIDLSEKWDGAVRDRIFATTMDLSRGPGADGAPPPAVILWPETSVPYLLSEYPQALGAMGEMLGDGQLLLAGAVRAEQDPTDPDNARYYNGIVAVDSSGGIVDAVDKVHLVPFGEYIPFADLMAQVGMTQFVAGPMNFEAGSRRHAMTLPGGILAVPFICYEVIFPALVAEDAADANLLVNITNDAWFGDTPGPYQHFRQLQLRAAENGLPAIRAANNGISGVIDSRGRVLDALALNTRGRIDAVVAVPAKPVVPLLSAQQVGFLVLATLAVAAIAARLQQRRQNN